LSWLFSNDAFGSERPIPVDCLRQNPMSGFYIQIRFYGSLQILLEHQWTAACCIMFHCLWLSVLPWPGWTVYRFTEPITSSSALNAGLIFIVIRCWRVLDHMIISIFSQLSVHAFLFQNKSRIKFTPPVSSLMPIYLMTVPCLSGPSRHYWGVRMSLNDSLHYRHPLHTSLHVLFNYARHRKRILSRPERNQCKAPSGVKWQMWLVRSSLLSSLDGFENPCVQLFLVVHLFNTITIETISRNRWSLSFHSLYHIHIDCFPPVNCVFNLSFTVVHSPFFWACDFSFLSSCESLSFHSVSIQVYVVL